eukprot:CAMPEP_0206487872 /NCGR_PEP_ID=MMETSP0324_2-20121206/41965_1 /ASSEMBLY_ACC=CAM_ASM_000836 /TAXON_ID=2866 /ORGANISM="Crypthecodinium cohnii, Strain Seligo" /LENGTH=68 /DNA_ID=CAMNT_0053966567 /DNA_START=33 /DNA_END=239 /DNA_ORIENTATION=+
MEARWSVNGGGPTPDSNRSAPGPALKEGVNPLLNGLGGGGEACSSAAGTQSAVVVVVAGCCCPHQNQI